MEYIFHYFSHARDEAILEHLCWGDSFANTAITPINSTSLDKKRLNFILNSILYLILYGLVESKVIRHFILSFRTKCRRNNYFFFWLSVVVVVFASSLVVVSVVERFIYFICWWFAGMGADIERVLILYDRNGYTETTVLVTLRL